MGSKGTSLEASPTVEYSDNPEVVLTKEEKEELCDYWNCREHMYGEEECPIKKAEKKVLQKVNKTTE